MQLKSISRELALLLLGQINKKDINKANIESLLSQAIESLTQHWREQLDLCASKLEKANQELLDSELQEDADMLKKSRNYLKTCLISQCVVSAPVGLNQLLFCINSFILSVRPFASRQPSKDFLSMP